MVFQRKVRMGGHPVHPALTDFPIALLTASLICQIVGAASGNQVWWQMAFWGLVSGLVLSVPTALTGLIDYFTIPEGDSARTTATWHLLANVVSICAYLGSLLVQGGKVPPSDFRGYLAIALSAAGFLVLFIGAWLGGHLVFHHGVGQERRDAERGDRPEGRPPSRG
jgi:uncharacterized membrane protein